MPAILLFDTCGATGFAAFADGEACLASRTLPGRETQERLLPAIADLLASVGVRGEDLAAVAVVTGPGSFTGVRVGVATAKGLSEAFDKPLIALSRLAVFAQAARLLRPPDAVTAWMDAGRTDVYVGSFPLRSGAATPLEAMLPRNAALAVARGTTIVTDDPALAAFAQHEVAPDALPGGDTQRAPEPLLLSASDIQRATVALAQGSLADRVFADTALLDANYLRIPDAEAALKAREETARRSSTESRAGAFLDA